MYATRTRTNKTVAATHWNGNTWSNGSPTIINDAYIDADYTTANGNFSCRDLIITGTAVLTITADTYVKVLRDIIQHSTTKVILKDKGSLMILNKNAITETAKIRVEKTFPDMQRLDYEFISSPISGIPIKNISPGTLDNRFYTFSEYQGEYLSLDPFLTLSAPCIGYMIRVPAAFPIGINDYNISLENNGTNSLNIGSVTQMIFRNSLGNNMMGNPYLSRVSLQKLYNQNIDTIEKKVYFWKKNNGAQGSSFYFSNIYTNNVHSNPNSIADIFQGFMIQKKSALPPNEIVFTPEMMLISNDYTPPDRIYINIKQNNIFHPIGGFCYDIKKFPIPFQDIVSGGAISIVDNDYKIICRKESFNTTDVINVRVFFEIPSNYTITLREFSGIFEEMPNIYLIDEDLQVIHDLKISDYSFSSEAGEYLNRFKIKFEL